MQRRIPRRNWTPIPRESGHRFHGKLGHPFQRKLDTDSRANWTTTTREAARGITVAPWAICPEVSVCEQEVIHAQDRRRAASALRVRGCTNREIARAVRASPTTVADYLRRAHLAGLSWPLAEGLNERTLEAALFPPQAPSRGSSARSPTGRRCIVKWAVGDRCSKIVGIAQGVLDLVVRLISTNDKDALGQCVQLTVPEPNAGRMHREHQRPLRAVSNQ